jgi:hypothetical protein
VVVASQGGPVGEAPFAVSTIDGEATVVGTTAIVVGADDLGLIAYRDAAAGALRMAHCGNPACTSAFRTVVDDNGSPGVGIDLAVDAHGRGVASYVDSDTGALRVAHCGGPGCSEHTIRTVVPSGVGPATAIAVGPNQRPLVAFTSADGTGVRLARCADPDCTSAAVTTLDGDAHEVVDLAVITPPDAAVLIAAAVRTRAASVAGLLTIGCPDVNCSAPVRHVESDRTILPYAVAADLGSDGRPHLALAVDRRSVNLFACIDGLCSDRDFAALRGSYPIEQRPTAEGLALATGPEGDTVVAYANPVDPGLRVYRCQLLECGPFDSTLSRPDPASSVGGGVDIAFLPSGTALLSYVDGGSDALKVVSCGNPACSPYAGD